MPEQASDPGVARGPGQALPTVKDGVCVVFIAEKLGVAQPTATKHLQELARAKLVISTRKAGWTFYKRNEEVIKRLIAA